ncbi:oligosaccharide repeat unit polymerase [Pseudescherichia vulneris]|uniref:O-antigen polymerase n=1 Tax=Pseudescherichia vulneris TaxID=566 RepID=UPI00227BF8E7|nr:O-antigen polymerase [Pseudescherichia vulneris]WAH52310.1 oligosaccharide repeat unit polymerase [Pseudescherichia vulneris]
MIYVSILAVITAIGLFVALYYIKANLTSPLSLHCLAWFLVSVIGLFAYDEFIEFPPVSYYAFLIWYVIIYFILTVGEMVTFKSHTQQYFYNKEYSCARYWIFVIPVAIYTIWEIYRVGTSGPASFFLNLRLANIDEDYSGEKFLVMTAVYPVMIAIFAIICMSKTSRTNIYAIVFWVMLFCIGTMGKFAVITPIIIFLAIREITKGLDRKKLVIYLPMVAVVILMLHFARMATNDDTTLSSVLGLYVYSPILALSKLSDLANNNAGEYTFRFLFAVLNKIGLSANEPVKTILDYVDVPVPTNVYTVMQPFFQDYSLYGVAFGAILYGIVFAFIYGSAKQGNPVSILAYAVLAVSLFTSFLTETLITNIAGNIKLIVCIYLLWRFTVKCRIKQ